MTDSVVPGADVAQYAVVVAEDVALAPAPPSESDLIAAAVLAVPGVVGLHGGAFGEIATYLPGRRVTGVRIVPDGSGPARIEVHVIARFPEPVAALAGRIRAVIAGLPALSGLPGPRPVDVHVEDYAVADDGRPPRPGPAIPGA